MLFGLTDAFVEFLNLVVSGGSTEEIAQVSEPTSCAWRRQVNPPITDCPWAPESHRPHLVLHHPNG